MMVVMNDDQLMIIINCKFMMIFYKHLEHLMETPTFTHQHRHSVHGKGHGLPSQVVGKKEPEDVQHVDVAPVRAKFGVHLDA